MSRSLKKITSFALPIAGAAIGSAVPGVGTALGATLGGAASGAVSGKGLKGIGIGALTGFAGNAIGSSLGTSLGSTLGKAGGSSLGSILGKTSSNAIGSTLLNTTFAQGLGKFAGNSIADNLVSGAFGSEQSSNPSTKLPSAPSGPAPFEPKQEAQLQLPNSLSGLSSFDPMQQSSNIATQGVYGGGNGPQEEDYFTNMINRRLVDESGKVDQDLSEVSPIESSYLSQLGLGGYNNPSSLLEALYGRKNQASYA